MRIIDIMAGLAGLPLLGIPLLVLSMLGLRFDRRDQLTVGRRARLFPRRLLQFREGWLTPLASRLGLDRVGDCLSLLKGDLALIGPRPLAPLEPHALAAYRITVRPGVISPFALGRWAGFGDETEDSVDFAYVHRRTSWSDLRLLGRSLQSRALLAITRRQVDRAH